MPNIRVRQALERIDSEINRVGEHAQSYSGINRRDISDVVRLCNDIIETAKQIKELTKDPVD
jgi:hypothetical protein